MSMFRNLLAYKNNINKALESVDENSLDQLYNELYYLYHEGIPLYICGNGGSAAISEHFSCDHTKGICNDTKLQSLVIPLNSNVSKITAIANDIGYDYIFSKQIDWLPGARGSLLIISSSGNSPNIIEALKSAKKRGFKTSALVGFDGGKAKELADICVHINSNNYGVVEDCHQIIMHVLAQAFRFNYAISPTTLKL